ncbi:MAG: hypothetical protein HC826_00460 [Rhodospirillales bacterium]|nr:hypothetical protein [Rhodospirillales bacterium]
MGVLILAYLFALALFFIALFGLFDQPRDPLGGVFLLPLGLPWNLFLGDTPDELRPWLTAAAPAINIFLLVGFCRAKRA